MYTRWAKMLARCSDPLSPNYHRYGGRGISVCDRWKTFENFESDMGYPLDGMSIDRINNDGNYEPSNCRWATQAEQCANRTAKGGPKPDANSIRQKAIAAGLPYSMVYQRIVLHGWPEDKALSVPRRKAGTGRGY